MQRVKNIYHTSVDKNNKNVTIKQQKRANIGGDNEINIHRVPSKKRDE